LNDGLFVNLSDQTDLNSFATKLESD